MRSISAKFLIVTGVIVILFFGISVCLTWRSVHLHVGQLTAKQAELALQFDLAIRKYVGSKIRPVFEEHLGKDEFIPEAMSTSFVARNVFESVRKEFPDYIIKFSSDNPRNPANAVEPEEMEILRYFRKNPEAAEWSGNIAMNGRPYYVHSIPRRVDKSCIHCHGRPEDAPASLIKRYGATAGFYRSLGEVIALDTVGIPLDKADAAIVSELRTQLAVLGSGILVLMAGIIFAFRRLVGNRLAAISKYFQSVTAQPNTALIHPIAVSGNDEISVLARSFNSLATRLHALHDSLEQQVEERTSLLQAEIEERRRTESALKQSTIAAEAANRAKDEFLANMSHEIRTPMTAIVGYSDMLLDAAKDPKMVDSAKVIKRNANHLLSVINDILDLSKIEAGADGVDREPCSPRQIVADVIDTMKVRADARGLTLDMITSDDVPHKINTDPIRLRQILINLVGNAIKFTELGGVRVTVRLNDIQGPNVILRFDIADTGIGMSEEQMGRLFQPFSQVDNSARRRFGGAGLGLAISKRLAALLGGDIAVVSTIGKGSIFSAMISAEVVDCPDTVQNVVDHNQHKPAGKNGRQRLRGRILLAEDGPDNQRLISTILKNAGCSVTCVENGEMVLAQFIGQEHPNPSFDLILMDMQMPMMDGYETTRQLRKMGHEGPVIALTAHAMKEDRRKCLDAGCDDYVTKPIDRRALVELVAKYVTEGLPCDGVCISVH